jgi:hypothetical protein
MASAILVPHVGMQKPGQVHDRRPNAMRALCQLPTVMSNPNYMTQASKAQMAQAAKYVNDNEWAELAQAINSSSVKHGVFSNPVAMGCLFGTCGICFCPVIYIGMQTEGKVNADIAELQITQKLKERGIILQWEPRTKFTAGGLHVTISANTPAAPQRGGFAGGCHAAGAATGAEHDAGDRAGGP